MPLLGLPPFAEERQIVRGPHDVVRPTQWHGSPGERQSQTEANKPITSLFLESEQAQGMGSAHSI